MIGRNLGLGANSGSSSLRSPEPVPVSAHAGNDPGREELRALTKPQQRVLLETAKVPDAARRGYRVTGAQWNPVNRLRELGLLFVDEYSSHCNRDAMWLKPTEKGRAWARSLSDKCAQISDKARGDTQ